MRLAILAISLLALPAGATTTFGTRYPAGSISDSARADAALKEAELEMKRIQQDARARDAECARTFLVNSCREDARRDKQLAEREVKRVQLEARDLQRRLQAEDVAKRKAKDAEAQAAKDARRLQEQESARADQAEREARLQQRDPGGVAKPLGTPDASAPVGNAPGKAARVPPVKGSQPTRQPPTQDPLSPSERAENARKFEEKQAQAAERAREQQAQREKNEQRRAEKRKEMEQREAEREALRQKAAQLPK